MRGMSSVYSVSSAPESRLAPGRCAPKFCNPFANTLAHQQGLGMLLGAGRISAATHDHILSLINEEDVPECKDNDSEKSHPVVPRLRKDDNSEKPHLVVPRLRQDAPSLLANPKHKTE